MNTIYEGTTPNCSTITITTEKQGVNSLQGERVVYHIHRRFGVMLPQQTAVCLIDNVKQR